MEQGIYFDLKEDTYHADPAPEPSLSASIAKVLLYKSPCHARHLHPRLNPNQEEEQKAEYDLGSAAHNMMLGDTRKFKLINPKNYLSKTGTIPKGYTNDAIKEARDAAYDNGEIPLLPHQFNEVSRMVEAGREQLAAHEVGNCFSGGKPEATIIWREGDIWCRIRIDYIGANGKLFLDYKTTEASANPDTYDRTFFQMSYDIQAAFYRRGIRSVLGIDHPAFRFVVQEVEKPCCLSVIGLDPAAEGIADRKVEEAIRIWSHCMKTNSWPGYPNRTCYIGAPTYSEKAWLEREMREEIARDEGTPTLEQQLNWQAPPDWKMREMKL